MPQYVILGKLTAKGLADLKGSPARLEGNIKAIEAKGGKVLSFHYTMGAYDYVMVAEGPSDEAVTTLAMAAASQGFVTTETLRAFTPEEFAGLVGQLP